VVIGNANKLKDAAKEFSLNNTLHKRMTHAKERERQGEELEEMMEKDQNILEATINSKKLSLEYFKTKNKTTAQDLEVRNNISIGKTILLF
jgi:hypothetical protein